MVAKKSGRDMVALFAGHIAHLLNGNDHLDRSAPVVEIAAFRLYERICHLLTENRRYCEFLIGLWSYPQPADPQDAAETYFVSVLERPIRRRAGKPSSANDLRDFLKQRTAGPMPLKPEPDELSTWSAMVDGPTRIRRCREQEDLHRLANLVLRCLDACNRPYAELLRLGLCPRDWQGENEVPVNSLKAANTLLKALKSILNGDYGRRINQTELQSAWQNAPVPGYADAAEFAASTLGRAVLSRLSGDDVTRTIAIDDLGDRADFLAAPEVEEIMSPDEVAAPLEAARRAGVISEAESLLLNALFSGEALVDALKSSLELRRRLRNDFDGDLELFVGDLSARLTDFSLAQASA